MGQSASRAARDVRDLTTVGAVPAGSPPELRLQLLGGFHAWVGPRPILAAAWRPKAGALVKLLALAPGRRLRREQAFDQLWPDFLPQAAANNLHATLHAARRALEPAPPPGRPSAYLTLHDDLLSLCAAAPLRLDVDDFTTAALAARRARTSAAYQAAVECYSGDLLPEDRYEDWAAAVAWIAAHLQDLSCPAHGAASERDDGQAPADTLDAT